MLLSATHLFVIKFALNPYLEEKAMLILTRREGESVRIGEDVTVTVLRVKGSQVRLGVNAPKNVAVQREELAERVRAQMTEASSATEATSAIVATAAAMSGTVIPDIPSS